MISTYHDLIQFIDLTNLSNELNDKELLEFCNKCHSETHKVAALCVEKKYVKFCKEYLSSTNVLVASVFNFPNGDEDISKIFDDITQSLSEGVDELDIVIPMERLKGIDDVNHFKKIIMLFASEIRNFVPNKTLKFIISTDVLKEKAFIQAATEAIVLAKGDFVKTCTGKNGQGITLEALQNIIDVIKSMKSTIGVKASGGIKSYKYAGEVYDKIKNVYRLELSPKVFRLGASSLLDDLLRHERLRIE